MRLRREHQGRGETCRRCLYLSRARRWHHVFGDEPGHRYRFHTLRLAFRRYRYLCIRLRRWFFFVTGTTGPRFGRRRLRCMTRWSLFFSNGIRRDFRCRRLRFHCVATRAHRESRCAERDHQQYDQDSAKPAKRVRACVRIKVVRLHRFVNSSRREFNVTIIPNIRFFCNMETK